MLSVVGDGVDGDLQTDGLLNSADGRHLGFEGVFRTERERLGREALRELEMFAVDS